MIVEQRLFDNTQSLIQNVTRTKIIVEEKLHSEAGFTLCPSDYF